MFEHYGINPTDFSNAYEAWVSALDPEIMVATNALFQQAIHVTGRYEDVFKIVRGDGSSRWIQALAEVIYDEAGKPVRAIGVNYDITEQKVSMLALEEAKKAAVKASRAKSEFLSNMSHEIRTPMNAIIGLSGLCLTETDTQLIQRRVNQIHRSGLLLLEIINDILDFSKIEAGKLIVEQVPFDMMQNIDHLDSLFAQMARDKDLILNKQIDPSLPCLLVGDSLRIRQVLTNLLGNAIKFTEHGCVTLSAQPEETEAGGQWIRFSVIDTGVGIAADNIQGLFDLFTQADSSITRRFGGTGLGLSISQKLVKAMGGSGIDVESVVGVGSTFSFALPLPAASDEQMQAVISQRADLALTRVERVSGHVLLVEDNLINQEVAQSMLTQIGLTVDIANNGLEAVERSAEQHYDMILMDIQMPVMDGYEASRRIRQRNVHIPIVALTAAAMIEDRDKAFAAGMNGHLGKPIKRDELASTLHHWLGGASTAQVAPIASEAPLAEPLVGLVSCIDRTALLASLGGDNDLSQRVESQFKQAVHDEYLPLLARLTQLSNSSSDAEWDSLKTQLHTLKGVSSSVTAHAIHALVQEIELLVKSHQLPSAQQLSALAGAFATCRG